jgi:hypothetical protein
VDHSCGLRGFCLLPDGPAPDFVVASGEEVDEVEGVVAGLDDLGQHAPLVLLLVVHLVALVLCAVGNDLSRAVGVDVVLYLLEPLVLLADEVVGAEVYQVNDLLGCDQSVGVYDLNLVVPPLPVTHPSVLG